MPTFQIQQMRMRIVLHHEDSYLLEAIQSPIQSWLVRPGTFRVSQPYDRPSNPHQQLNPSNSSDILAIDTYHPSPPIVPRARKKQKLSKSKENEKDAKDSEGILLEWIQVAYHDLLVLDKTELFINNMQGNYFYGTCVDAPANDTFALDLVKLQPTLRLIKSGFVSASDVSLDRKDAIQFDEVQLRSRTQQLDISDIYETLIENNHRSPALITFPTEGEPRYLIPPLSGFVVSDLDRIHGLKSIAQRNGGFNIIVMDPPWQNASVDRMAHYGTLDLYDLFKIPIPDLLGAPKEQDLTDESGSGGIVAVWITNRAKVKKVVVEKLFPAWGLDFVAQWSWLKITTGGEPVLSLENGHRRAYEGILIGKQKIGPTKNNTVTPQHSITSTVSKKLLVSVPSQHSRKPSLNAILEKEFFSKSCVPSPDSTSDFNASVASGDEFTTIKPLKRLELFARNLEEGVLSWGNEPIRYQYCGRGSEDTEITQDGYLVPSYCSVVKPANKR
ncbi:Methyltransferase-like protein 4 [Mortierella sp. AD094]|nr:Methyltransferase-like protein 4 [Mortierella sp. AD094]